LCAIDFDRVRAHVKIQSVIFPFKSSTPYIGEKMRDIGECKRNKWVIEKLEQDVGILLDLVNVVE